MNFRPKKSLGQNFLTNKRIVEKIIKTACLDPKDTVVEVGPGFGVLTEALLDCAKKVIAIEKDRRLFEYLADKFSRARNLELVHADVLNVPLPKTTYSLIANIPYSITSPILDHFIRENPTNLPQKAVLLVQKEVAQKLCAAPPRMNVLALHVQTFGRPKIIAPVSKNNFRPRPKVDSAIIKIDFPKTAEINVDLGRYFDLIHCAFSQKRKMLKNSLPEALLTKANIDPARRPETISIEEWIKLTVYSGQELLVSKG